MPSGTFASRIFITATAYTLYSVDLSEIYFISFHHSILLKWPYKYIKYQQKYTYLRRSFIPTILTHPDYDKKIYGAVILRETSSALPLL